MPHPTTMKSRESIRKSKCILQMIILSLISVSYFGACFAVYSIPFNATLFELSEPFQSEAFQQQARNIELSSAQLDLSQETAILAIQFSNRYSDCITISQKSTKGVEGIVLAGFAINNSYYILELGGHLSIPAQSKSKTILCRIRNKSNNAWMDSSAIKKLLEKKFVSSNQLRCSFTIQSCYSNNKVYDNMSTYTYRRDVCIK